MSSAISATAVAQPSYPSLLPTRNGREGGTTVAGTRSNATGSDAFGVSVSVSVSLAAITQTFSSSQVAQDGEKVLATLQQSQQSVREQNKEEAAAKLDEAVKELSLLKILGNTVDGAREAVKLAKQIADAVKEYAAAGGSSSANTVSAIAADLSQSAGTIGDTGTTSASAPAASNKLATAQQDPFYAIAGAALAALQKYLKKTLPALQESSDPRTRAEARKLAREFNKAVDSVDAVELTPGQTPASTADSGGTTSGTTLAIAIAASVDLVA